MEFDVNKASLLERNQNNFKYHPASDKERIDLHQKVRSMCKELADELVVDLPLCRELSLALTALEEVMMWSNAAIARSDVVSTEEH